MITPVRVQEKGQVTIPRDIRRKLHLKKGDLVTFISTESGIVIKKLDSASKDLFETLRSKLLTRDIQLDTLLERAQVTNANLLKQEFGLDEYEQQLLFQALQLKAQAAVETIRSLAEQSGIVYASEEDIDTEIQDSRST